MKLTGAQSFHTARQQFAYGQAMVKHPLHGARRPLRAGQNPLAFMS